MFKETVGKISRFIEERAIWIASGRPYRSKDRMLEIYNTCVECPNFQSQRGKYGICGICKCNLHPTETLLPNKIAWATTECPEKKWEADVEIKDIQLEEADIKSAAEAPEEGPIVARDKNIRKGCNCK
jgi:hypothetical protein